MQKTNPNFRFFMYLMVILTFSAGLLPLAQAETSSSDKQSEMVILTFSPVLLPLAQAEASSSDKQSEGPRLEGGEFVFPEYANEDINSVEAQAIRAAEEDASAHLNKLFWFTTGFSLPVVGPLLSQRNQRSIPGARLLGKSPEYVAFYTNAYRIKMKKLRFNWSLIGCLSSVTAAGLTIFLVIR